MMLEVILCQRFWQGISNVVFGIDREYLDESLACMFAKNGDNKRLNAWSLDVAWEVL